MIRNAQDAEAAGRRYAHNDGNVFDDDEDLCRDAWKRVSEPDPLNHRVIVEATEANRDAFRRGYLAERRRTASSRVKILMKIRTPLGQETRWCVACGNPMTITSHGIAHHVCDGKVDHDADADHVAIADDGGSS